MKPLPVHSPVSSSTKPNKSIQVDFYSPSIVRGAYQIYKSIHYSSIRSIMWKISSFFSLTSGILTISSVVLKAEMLESLLLNEDDKNFPHFCSDKAFKWSISVRSSYPTYKDGNAMPLNPFCSIMIFLCFKVYHSNNIYSFHAVEMIML